MLVDHDYRPDEPTVRIFRTPSPGVLRLDDEVEQGRLLGWLGELAPFGSCQPPRARPMRRGPVPDRLRPGIRRTW